MLLSIKEMEVQDLPFAESFAPGAVDFSGSGAEQQGDLRTEGLAQVLPDTGGEVRVKGWVKTRMSFECDRCLAPTFIDVDAPFDLFYTPAAIALATKEDELAIDADEAEMGFYVMPGLELEDILREQVLFALPMQRVCQADCLGICPECGGNRNETPCQCQSNGASHGGNEPVVDARWGALREVHIETK